jgi:hypothetical protein
MAPICTPLNREFGFDCPANEPANADGDNERAVATVAAEPINLRRDTPLLLSEFLKFSMKSNLLIRLKTA